MGWCLSARAEGPDCASGTSFTLRPRWPGITLAGVTPGLGFYGLRSTAWAGQFGCKAQRAAGGCDFAWGLRLCPQRQRRMSVKSRGFSLAGSAYRHGDRLAIADGGCRFLPALQRESFCARAKAGAGDEIWQRVHAVGKHLQRAGYCRGAVRRRAGNCPLAATVSLCSWDANSNGIWDREPAESPTRLSPARRRAGNAARASILWRRMG